MDCLNKSYEKITFKPKRPPYELTREYLLSKEAKRKNPRLFDCGDSIRTANVQTSGYFGEQELVRVDGLLGAKRIFAAKKRTELDEQWEDLQKREGDLKQMFIKFNQFISENSDKRKRAGHRIIEMKALWEHREKEIERLSLECTKLEHVKQRMSQMIVTYKLFENFLRDVVEMYPDQFQSPMDVLHRYELVRHTSRELSEHHATDMDHLEEAKKALTKTVDRYIVQLSGLHTEATRLQQRHEEAAAACRHLEDLYERLRAKATERLMDVVAVKESARRIYGEMCERKGAAPVLEGDHVGQFEVIKATLRDYRRINELARRAEKEGAYASERPRVSEEGE